MATALFAGDIFSRITGPAVLAEQSILDRLHLALGDSNLAFRVTPERLEVGTPIRKTRWHPPWRRR
ncbi:hypothetical protein ATY81_15880 [Rhizobium sp. R72]|nr:hypothetical protein ATY81_15880 [Rhizobium sp. R72]OWV92863.1 hypothetical protein ATY80_15880 [Rhizobium sp. R711]